MDLSPLLCYLRLIALLNVADGGSHSIYRDIFKDYTKNLRPVKQQNSQTHVQVDSGLFSIDEINALKETITMTTWLWMIWDDEFLKWDPTEFDNITELSLPVSLVWVPDVVIIGMQEVIYQLDRQNTFGGVTSDGQVSVTFLQVVKVHCDFDIKLFPFDSQNCTVRYGSWEFDAKLLDLSVMKDGFGISQFQDNTEWELISYDPKRVVSYDADSTYVEIHYHLVIKRRPMYYIFALVVPSFVITMLAVVGLFSPFNSFGERQEKVTMGLTTLLTMAILLLIVAEQMPKSSEGLPLIGMYILCEIIVASVATCVTVANMCLHRQAVAGKPAPAWLLKALCLTDNKTNHTCFENPTADWDDFPKSALPIPSTVSSKHKSSMLSEDKLALLAKQVEVCICHLEQIHKYVSDKTNEDHLLDLWRRITDRIDIIAMCGFMVLNVLLTLIMIMVVGMLH